MARPSTKEELMKAAELNYVKMNELIGQLTDLELSTPFDFGGDVKKTQAHWTRDKNLRDVLIHLYEWHQLLLDWVRTNSQGGSRPFIPQPYNFRTYGAMNVELWKQHQATSLEVAKEMLKNSHKEVMGLVEGFSNEDLFSKGVYKWVGGSTLGSYCVSATASHYDWAIKKLKAHRRNCVKKA